MESSAWVDCLVSIRFDLDIGPKIESIHPPDAITEEGKVKLLYCAFPDCNPDCGYNFIFHFSMADCTTASERRRAQMVALPSTGSAVSTIYGVAFYRQKYDVNVPRHYVQQVIVLLTHLPYHNVHELILRIVAPRFCQCCSLSPDQEKAPISSVLSPRPETYFEVDHSYTPEHYSQEAVLEEAMEELSRWPSPHPVARYTVTLLQQSLVFLTPPHTLRREARAARNSVSVRRAASVDARVEFLESHHSGLRAFKSRANGMHHQRSLVGLDALPLFSLLGDQLHHLTYIWELLIQHESLLILSNTPCVASATAFAVASLVMPISFDGVLKSYFTVQNDDFPRLSRMGKGLHFPVAESLIVAGTNPFLIRSFSGWPSLLAVVDQYAGASSRSSGSPLLSLAERHSDPTALYPLDALETNRTPPAEEGDGVQPLSFISPSLSGIGSASPYSRYSTSGCSSASERLISKLSYRKTCATASVVVEEPKVLSGSGTVTAELQSCQNGCSSNRSHGSPTSAAVAQRKDHEVYALDSSSPSSSSSRDASTTSRYTGISGAGCSSPPVASSTVGGNDVGSLPILQPPSDAFSVPLFTPVHYQSMLSSIKMHAHRKRGSAHQESSRQLLQQHLYSYFDSSHAFLLDHPELTAQLLNRLQLVSLLDAATQRALVSQTLHDNQGSPRCASVFASAFSSTTERGAVAQGSSSVAATAATTPSTSPLLATPTPTTTTTTCSHYSAADDIIQKFFSSLTTEFLSPITLWFHKTTAPYTAFHLCDRAFADSLLHPRHFLEDFAVCHRETAPSIWTERCSYKTYRAIYEKFCGGCLYRSYMTQLVDEMLRRELETFQVEEWLARVPAETERIDLLITFLNVVQHELNDTIDPDVLFVTSATSVLASMAVVLSDPHRDQFMLKIVDLTI